MEQSNQPTDIHDATGASPVEMDRSHDQVRVFYDGACPLCRQEIAFLKARDSANAMRFEDISNDENVSDGEVVPGLSCDAALKRMHIQRTDGTIESGARAFLTMWGAVPRYAPVVRVLRTPPIPWVLEGLYRAFLVVRPGLQWIAGKRA